MSFRSDLETLILALLSHRAMHGYEISKQIAELSNELLKYGEAQLYPALRRLESEGAVSAHWEQQEGKPSRRVYCITPKGRLALDNKKQSWSEFVTVVDSILNANPKGSEA